MASRLDPSTGSASRSFRNSGTIQRPNHPTLSIPQWSSQTRSEDDAEPMTGASGSPAPPSASFQWDALAEVRSHETSSSSVVNPFLTPVRPTIVGRVSSETVRGSSRVDVMPRTPYPLPLGSISSSEFSVRNERQPISGQSTFCSQGDLHQIRKLVLRCIIDGAILVLECVGMAAMIVFTLTATWKDNEDGNAGGWIWICIESSFFLTLLGVLTTILVHELHDISTIAFLCIHSTILVIITVTVLALWKYTPQLQSQEAFGRKGLILGCSVFIWGIAVLAFARASLTWWFEGWRTTGLEGGDGSLGQEDRYGTFHDDA